MFRTIQDAREALKETAAGTKSILAVLTDQNLGQAVAPGHRTLGQVAWHIVVSIPEMMNRTGLGLTSVSERAPVPSSADEIRTAYERVSSELLEALGSWSDETLLQEDDMYGQRWPRGKTLAALIGHEVHHRGQMTVLLRQAGVKVPGVFGPSKEEWSRFGMEAPPY
jgi:uncharacterized damage-inducible protein DinB